MSWTEEEQEYIKTHFQALKDLGVFDKLLDHVYTDEYNREVLPHMALIPDWYLYWRDLKDHVKQLLE